MIESIDRSMGKSFLNVPGMQIELPVTNELFV